MATPPAKPLLACYNPNGTFSGPPASWPPGATTNIANQYFSMDASSPWSEFGAGFITQCATNGLIAFVEIEPWNFDQSAILFSAITSGSYDTWLTDLGASIAASGKPCMITFAHEMNVSGQYPWSWNDTGSGPGGGNLTAAEWIAGWKYVRAKVNSTAGGLALWIWACSANTGGSSTTSPIPWWPGASFVDMVGIDGYEALEGSPTTFNGVFGSTLADIRGGSVGWAGDVLVSETNLALMVSGGGDSIATFVADMASAGMSGIVEFEDVGLPAMTSSQWTQYNNAVAAHFPSGTAHPGAAALSGLGTFTAAGLKKHRAGAAAITGTGTLTGGGVRVPRGHGAVSVSGSGSLTAGGAARPFGTALRASPVLAVTPRVIKNAVAAFSVPARLTASGFVPMFLARPALAASALVTHPAAAVLAAAPALHAATSSSSAALSAAPKLLAPGRMGSALFLAGTSLTASGQFFMPGQAALAASPHLTTSARVTQLPSARLSASTAMAAAALLKVPGTAPLSAPAHLAATPFTAAAHLAAGASLSAAGRSTAVAAAALHAAGTATAAARVTVRAAAAFSAAAALTPRGTVSKLARTSLSAAPALRGTGTRTVLAHVALSAPAGFRARGALVAVAASHLPASPSMGAVAAVSPGARMSASPSLSGGGTLTRPGRASLSAGARLSGTAHGTTFPAMAWQALGTLQPTPLGVVRAATALSASPRARFQADTRPGLPFPRRPARQQPAWQRDVQGFAVAQERQRHAQALWQYGELVVFSLMWRPEDIERGLARRCTRCYTPSTALVDLPPETPLPTGYPTAATEAQISAAYGQGNQFRCTLCFGTQVIANRDAEVPGVRALLVRPAILTDTDQNQQRTAKGVVSTGSVQVQSTPDFRVSTLDYFFRSDGRRYQLAVPQRTTLRTGFGSPWQAAAAISYNMSTASLEDQKASVAYVIPPPRAELERVLGTYTRIPADYAWFEQVNGPLIPGEGPPPAAYGWQQPDAVLGV